MGVRVVIFPLPLQGHVTPMLHLATLLHSKGFSITIIQTQYKSLDPTQFPHFTFHSLEDGLPDNVEFAPNNLTKVLDSLNTNCLEPFRIYLSKIMSQHNDNDREPVACLIADPMWSFAAPVASSLSLPRVVVRCASMFTFYLYHCLQSLQQKGYYPLQESNCDELVPELAPLKIKDLPPETTHKLLTDIMTEMETSEGIICNTFEELEGTYIARIQKSLPIPIFPIGPININSSSQASILVQDHTSIAWLDTKAPKSVLYVSFGSIASISKADFLEIAYGLANSKQPFLWVVRDGLITGSKANDPLPLPEDFRDMIRQRGHIVNWAPQQAVLAHPAVGGFWTHSGWNSIMESISEGVPMLCLPFFADQIINTRHVSDSWKIGLQLEKGMVREEIEQAIRKLMVEEEGKKIRNRIKALKEKATLSVMEGGPSYQSLEKLNSYLQSFSSTYCVIEDMCENRRYPLKTA